MQILKTNLNDYLYENLISAIVQGPADVGAKDAEELLGVTSNDFLKGKLYKNKHALDQNIIDMSGADHDEDSAKYFSPKVHSKTRFILFYTPNWNVISYMGTAGRGGHKFCTVAAKWRDSLKNRFL